MPKGIRNSGNYPVGDWRIKPGDGVRHFFIGKHVAEKTNAERKRTNEVTDQLDRENQRRRSTRLVQQMFEMSEIPFSLMPIQL